MCLYFSSFLGTSSSAKHKSMTRQHGVQEKDQKGCSAAYIWLSMETLFLYWKNKHLTTKTTALQVLDFICTGSTIFHDNLRLSIAVWKAESKLRAQNLLWSGVTAVIVQRHFVLDQLSSQRSCKYFSHATTLRNDTWHILFIS